MTVGYSKQKAGARGKVIKKNPHRLFRADGGLKEGNGIGEPYAHLADISCKHGAKEVYPNVANPHRLKSPSSRYSTPSATALGRELGPNGARLGQDLTYGEVRFVLAEPVRRPALGGSGL